MRTPRCARLLGMGMVLACLVVTGPLFAQQPARSGEPQVAEKAGKELNAHYVGDSPPRIDGRLDDEIWLVAQSIDDLVQNDPDNMTPPTERTVVKVAYDDRSIYVAVVNHMRDVSQVTTALGRRDTSPAATASS